MLNFTSKCPKIHLVAGLRMDPLGELTALPSPLDGLNGRVRKEGEGGERGRKKGE